jgi:hypothetical protein
MQIEPQFVLRISLQTIPIATLERSSLPIMKFGECSSLNNKAAVAALTYSPLIETGSILSMMAFGVAMVAGDQLIFGQDTDVVAETTAATLKRVDVTIGVMSRCPDALFFENAFRRTFEQVNKKISLSLVFIATKNDSATYDATCKHGEEECRGNIHQLCMIDALRPSKAGKRYDIGPSEAQRIWWDFVQCENYNGLKRIGEESLAKQCIQAIGGVPHWESDGVEDCAIGERGRVLLKDSIDRVEEHGITNSATLQIEGETVCIRDNGQWKDCTAGHETSDWVRQIEKAYLRKNPSLQVHVPTQSLYKRQNPAPSGNGTLSNPASSPSQTDGGGQQGAPLSVFVSKRLFDFGVV